MKIFLSIFLMSGCITMHGVYSQSADFRDTLTVQSFRVTPDIRSDQVEGIRLAIKYNLVYDVAGHKAKRPLILGIRADFYHPDGLPIHAASGTSFHVSPEGFAVTVLEDMSWPKQDVLFMPYYALDLPAGENSIRVKLTAFLKDTAVIEDNRNITVRGIQESTVNIRKPNTRSFRMMVRELRVNPRNAKGNHWDFGFLSPNDPDLQSRIVLKSKEHSDDVHISSSVEDALSAAWIDFSNPITISINDKITLVIYDKDLFFHDLIGEVSFTLDEWIKIGNAKQSIKFGFVSSCVIDIEEITAGIRQPENH